MKYDLKDIIYKIDVEDMREFLYVSLIHDEDLLNRFRVEFSSYFPKLSKDDYEDKIITAIYSCMDKHGYIDYESADSYEIAMLEYVSEAEKIAAILVNLFKMRYNIDEIYREGTRLK